jgi:hypothetical protein
MLSTLTRAALVAAALSTTACAPGVLNRPLDTAKRETVSKADVVAVVPQADLYADIVVANSGAATAQYGLLGALIGGVVDGSINTSRSKDAEAAVRPLRDGLLGYSFETQLSQELDRELGGLTWLGANPMTLSKKGEVGAKNAVVYASKATTLLMVHADYHMSPDFSKLIVTAEASLLPVPKADGQNAKKPRSQTGPADKSKALYYNTLNVEATLAATGTLEQNREKWAANNLLLRSLKAQTTELARLVAMDLAAAAPAAPLKADEAIAGGKGTTTVRRTNGTITSMVALDQLPAEPMTAGAAAAGGQ